MDPTLAGETKALLEPRQLELIDAQLDARAVAQTHDEIKDSKCSMMPRQFEVVAAGSHFQWGLSSNVYSDLEADTLNLMLAAYLSDMQVGGKAGTATALGQAAIKVGIGALGGAALAPLNKPAAAGFAVGAIAEPVAGAARSMIAQQQAKTAGVSSLQGLGALHQIDADRFAGVN